ncbi:hypothetical protein L6452_18289 [Arctium lappa]|uniref:Uncharacterized protein n=1 Tax=Arctium lappa TaxID=4217 RepID=A0ACB9C5X8_ARCLA|nr:hypothetical protein L6452_18289 [Arctium lappa]
MEVYGLQVLLTETRLAIVMEYASGGELFDRISNASRFSEDEARFFFQQLISGVSYCHSMIADVWSCGVTLYVMLVGAYPFEDDDDPRNFRKTLTIAIYELEEVVAVYTSFEANNSHGRCAHEVSQPYAGPFD